MTGGTRRPAGVLPASAPARRRPLARLAALVGATAMVVALAACAPEAPEPVVETGVAYGEADGAPLKLDACLPEGDGPHDAVVVVHGGAFSEGDRTTMTGVCEALAGAGFAAFAVDYRLLPATYPAPVDDVSAAVSWLREPAQTERFGLGDRVSLLGSSAGAIIALSTAAALDAAGAPVSAVVGLSAAADLTENARTLGAPPAQLEQVVLGYLGCDRLDACDDAAAASPIEVAAQLPPTLLVHGSDELIPVEQAEALEAALEDAGVDSDLTVVEGSNHGLQLLNSRTRASIAQFLTDGGTS